jgi:pimeloyl-ACP methyl ester carboxylesterase
MSRHHGKSVSKAVLVSASLPFRLKTTDNPLGAEQAAFDKTAQAIRDDRPKFLAGFFEKFFAVTDADPVSPQVLEWARSIGMQASLQATLGCAKSFTTTDFRPELASFKVPTLIIHGSNDQVVPIGASSRLTAKGIAHATLLEYDGAPHGLFATHKARLTTDLLDFLKA